MTGKGRRRSRSLTCGHDTCRGNRHYGDVLGGVHLVQVSPECTHASSSRCGTPTSFLFGDQPHPGPCVHRAGDGEHSRGVVGGGGGRRGGVREGGRVGLLLTQLLLCLVQEHGVLDLEVGGRKEGRGEVIKRKGVQDKTLGGAGAEEVRTGKEDEG